jgi:hypothetical protein
VGVGRRHTAKTAAENTSKLEKHFPTPTPPHKGEGNNYAASAFAGFSGGVIAPDTLISPTSFAE